MSGCGYYRIAFQNGFRRGYRRAIEDFVCGRIGIVVEETRAYRVGDLLVRRLERIDVAFRSPRHRKRKRRE